jgi:hypothetical protein
VALVPREANGVETLKEMRDRIAFYRRVAIKPGENPHIGCIMLAEPFFWPREAWILHRNRGHVEDLPENLGTPFELIALAKPKKPVEDDFTGLEYRADWFANWLAMCLPKEEELQDKVLREISLWAREPRRFVSELMNGV